MTGGRVDRPSALPPVGEKPERLLTDHVCEAFWERDVDGETLRWSGNLETIFGYPRAEVPDRFDWWRERVHPEDVEPVLQGLHAAIRGKAAGFSCEYRFRRKDGTWAWVASRSFIIRDARDKPLRVVGAMIDVTRIKEAESRLQTVLTALPVGAMVLDRSGNIIVANPELERIWGRLTASGRDRWLKGTAYWHTSGVRVAPDQWASVRALEQGQTSRNELIDIEGADGRRMIIDNSAAPIRDAAGNVVGAVAVHQDVTERVRAGEALSESQEHLRTVLDTLPLGAVVLDQDGNVTLANPALHRIWGRLIVSGNERWQRSTGYWHGSGAKIEPDQWASVRALRKGQTTLNELIDIETFEGGRKVVENSAAPIRDAEGKVVGAVAVIQDVTERVHAEEGLRKTERLLADAERLGGTGSWEMDLVTGQILNSEANRRLFFGDDESKGARLEDYVDVIHPDDRERVMGSREAMLDGSGPNHNEYRIIWPDGSEHMVLARATVIRDESGKPVRIYGTNADITERKRTHEELERRARQLELLSRKLIQTQESERRALSNELHDDLGQALFALKLNLERDGGGHVESIGLVDGAIARMRDLVHALRPPLLDEFGLEASLRWHAEREAKRAGLAFDLAFQPLEQRPPVMVEITCFRVAQEALSNIVRHSKARAVDIRLSEADGVMELLVRDDGQGFDVAAARARAASGASQGLLSMRERVTLVGGDLEIDSVPGRGTSVRARLPLTATGGG